MNLNRNAFSKTDYQRHLFYFRYLVIGLVALPLFSAAANLVEGNVLAACVNAISASVFGIIYLCIPRLGWWFYPITCAFFQLYIIVQSSVVLPGNYIEAALGLFVVVSPVFLRGNLLRFFFVTATIGYYLPWYLGHYDSYYETSFLLYVVGFLLIRYVIRERDHAERSLLEKQALIERQQTEIERLNALQSELAERRNEEQWLNDLTRAIQSQLDNPDFKVECLTEQLNTGRTQLFQRVKETTGLTPNQFLTEMRLQRAKELLESHSVDNVKAAQLAVGIRRASYFAKKYKERFGVLPSESLKLQ